MQHTGGVLHEPARQGAATRGGHPERGPPAQCL